MIEVSLEGIKWISFPLRELVEAISVAVFATEYGAMEDFWRACSRSGGWLAVTVVAGFDAPLLLVFVGGNQSL